MSMTDIVKEADVDHTELGRWIGRREAFGLVAGRCSAADIEILRRLREEKRYLSKSPTWEEFCKSHLGVSRRSADREIAYLREFGPNFFTIRQLTHVTVDEYRQIADRITEVGVQVDGALVPIDAQDPQPIADAVEKLLRQCGTKPIEAAPFDTLLRRCRGTVQSLRGFAGELNGDQTADLAAAVMEIRSAAAQLGVRVWDR